MAFAQLVFLLFPVPSAQEHRMETPTFKVSLPRLLFLSENINWARVWGGAPDHLGPSKPSQTDHED